MARRHQPAGHHRVRRRAQPFRWLDQSTGLSTNSSLRYIISVPVGWGAMDAEKLLVTSTSAPPLLPTRTVVAGPRRGNRYAGCPSMMVLGAGANFSFSVRSFSSLYGETLMSTVFVSGCAGSILGLSVTEAYQERGDRTESEMLTLTGWKPIDSNEATRTGSGTFSLVLSSIELAILCAVALTSRLGSLPMNRSWAQPLGAYRQRRKVSCPSPSL